jgi:hypothetical protein
MIDPRVLEIARQRHRELLAGADRYRLGRNVRDRRTYRRTASDRLNPTRLAFGNVEIAAGAPIRT